MIRIWKLSLSLFVLTAFAVGCRRNAPPSFSPGKEVLQLTAELEDADAEEVALYQDLQTQISDILKEHSGTPNKPKMLGQAEDDNLALQRGYAIFSRYCTQCHGVNGDGQGALAKYLNPKPRDYTRGIFKFTSTPYGKKPRHSDLIRTVRQGVQGTSMPSFDRFTEDDIHAVVDYVLVLTLRGELQRELAMIAYDDEELPDEDGLAEIIDSKLEQWKKSSQQLVMPVTAMPPMTDETVAGGHQLFLKNACNKCHGKFGRGGSMGNVEIGTDAWGNKGAAADLSSGMFRGGRRPVDIYRRIYSGINGTPMPAFETTFRENPDAIWQLVHFIKATSERRRQGMPPLSEADLPSTPPTETNESPEVEPAPDESVQEAA